MSNMHNAKRLGVTRQALSALLNGRAGVSASMALRLEGALGTTSRIISPAAGCRIALRTLARIMPLMRLHPVHAHR